VRWKPKSAGWSKHSTVTVHAVVVVVVVVMVVMVVVVVVVVVSSGLTFLIPL